jgi:hypothetical protein
MAATNPTTTATKSNTKTAAAAPSAPTEPSGTALQVSEKKPLSAEEKKQLFVAFAKAEDNVAAAEKAVEDAKNAKSAAIATLVEGCGKGPFRFRGEEITFVKGKESKEGANDGRWTSRVKTEREVQDIGS